MKSIVKLLDVYMSYTVGKPFPIIPESYSYWISNACVILKPVTGTCVVLNASSVFSPSIDNRCLMHLPTLKRK